MKSKNGFVQAYNAQAAVDAYAQIIVAHALTHCGSGRGQLVPRRAHCRPMPNWLKQLKQLKQNGSGIEVRLDSRDSREAVTLSQSCERMLDRPESEHQCKRPLQSARIPKRRSRPRVPT